MRHLSCNEFLSGEGIYSSEVEMTRKNHNNRKTIGLQVQIS